MADKESFTQQALERIRSGASQGDSAKKRRISRILLLVDVILVIFLILYFTNRGKEEDIQTGTLSFGNIQARLTLAKNRDRELFMTTLTLSNRGREQTLAFTGNMAILRVRKNDEVLLERTLGPGLKSLTLAADEARTFSLSIPFSKLRQAAGYPGEERVRQRKTLFQFQEDYIPLTLTCALQTGEKISLELPLRLEVNE
jgi:hypothetical protein